MTQCVIGKARHLSGHQNTQASKTMALSSRVLPRSLHEGKRKDHTNWMLLLLCAGCLEMWKSIHACKSKNWYWLKK